MRYLYDDSWPCVGGGGTDCARRGVLDALLSIVSFVLIPPVPHTCSSIAANPDAARPAVGPVASPAPLWADDGWTSNKSMSMMLAPGEPTTPFMIAGAGAAASEWCEPTEPAAKVGAVDGALKPPSEDAMVARGKRETAEQQSNRHQHYG